MTLPLACIPDYIVQNFPYIHKMALNKETNIAHITRLIKARKKTSIMLIKLIVLLQLFDHCVKWPTTNVQSQVKSQD